jgi:hypothetical protein
MDFLSQLDLSSCRISQSVIYIALFPFPLDVLDELSFQVRT